MAFGKFGARGSYGDIGKNASRRLAIESTQNIANLSIAEPSQNEDVSAVADLLREHPRAVADVAETLSWGSERAADALAQGGNAGLLKFSKDGDTTIVGLAED